MAPKRGPLDGSRGRWVGTGSDWTWEAEEAPGPDEGKVTEPLTNEAWDAHLMEEIVGDANDLLRNEGHVLIKLLKGAGRFPKYASLKAAPLRAT